MKLFAFPLIAAILSFSACSETSEASSHLAEQTVNTKPAPQKMERIGNWLVVKADSHIEFTASQQGSDFTGAFKHFDVFINFNENALEKANVTATIDLGSISAGDKDRDGALPGKDWFDIKAFPKAVFHSNEFMKTGDNSYEARGTLSMKGKNQPLALPFTLDINGAKAEMSGSVTLDRTLWDIGSGAWASDEWVSTDVTVDIKISAESPF